MKRKLNEHDVPVEVEPQEKLETAAITEFANFGLDPRLLQAISKQKFANPTPVQSEAIPQALEGKNIVARARTGSGKTAAYLLPLIQSLLRSKQTSNKPQAISALILVPTRELANQVTKQIALLTAYASKDVQSVNLTTQNPEQAQRALLASNPDIVVSTPARAAQHLNAASFVADGLTHLVIDEADLVLDLECRDDCENIVGLIPRGVQTFLASATLSTEVNKLYELFCQDPVVVDIQDAEQDIKSVSQYVVQCAEDEKFLLLFAIFKLKLVKGKCIIFVADVDRCYRVKLYLEQFGIKSCVLNSELPVNSRVHAVEEFNKNVYDIIIASDEHEVMGSLDESKTSKKQKKKERDTGDEPEENGEESRKDASKSRKAKKEGKRDNDYGIARGIDFQRVECVLNFDLPRSARSYTHRIGRTARAGRTGIALSFVIPANEYRKHKLLTHPSTESDPRVLEAIRVDQTKRAAEQPKPVLAGAADDQNAPAEVLQPFRFDMDKLTAFQYRVTSALKAVSAGAIREARLRELRQEMLKSEKLRRHLEENPDDLGWIRHDAEGSRSGRVQSHLKHVPEYLLPGGAGTVEKPAGFVGIGKGPGGGNRIREARKRNRARQMRAKGGKKLDPLKSFNIKGRK